MEEDTTQGNMKEEGIINLKFKVIIITNVVIMLMNVEVLIIWKNKSTILKRKIKKNLPYCWHIKEQVKEKTHSILTLEQAITCMVSKTYLRSLMNRKVTMLLWKMHPKF